MINLEFKETSLMYGDKEVSVAYLGDTEVYSPGLPIGTTFDFDYTGAVQEVTLPKGRYKLQCWGAQGGDSSYSGATNGGYGGYSEGILELKEKTTLYVFVGGRTYVSSSGYMQNGGWNGGGGSTGYSSGGSSSGTTITSGLVRTYPGSGGGGTDIATITSTMEYVNYITNRSNESLLSRFIVAGGGAGNNSRYYKYTDPDTTNFKTGRNNDYNYGGGGVEGIGGCPGTQSSAGTGTYNGGFGHGASQSMNNKRYAAAGGGGGWYGGGTSYSSNTNVVSVVGGGSGFVNIRENAQYRPAGYTGLELLSGKTIDGDTKFESPSGGTEKGHNGNGYARITKLSTGKVKTQLQWISANGTQYINTEYFPNYKTKMTMSIYWDDTSKACWFFGVSYTDIDVMRYGLKYSLSNNNFQFCFAGSSIRTTLYTDWIDLYINKNAITIDGDDYALSDASFTLKYPLYLFAVNNAGYAEGNASMKFYQCQIWDDVTMMHDFVPVLTTDNQVGLFDKVTSLFYPSEGSKQFFASDPKQYTQLEYLENDGTNYIDTCFKPDNNTRVIVDFQMLETTVSKFLYGCRNSSYYNAFCFLITSATNNFRASYGSAKAIDFTTNMLERYTIDHNKNVAILNGVTNSTVEQSFTSNINLYLFCSNKNGEIEGIAKARIYSCKIYDNDVLIRDYIPVEDEAGKKGLYDKCTNLFYELKN